MYRKTLLTLFTAALLFGTASIPFAAAAASVERFFGKEPETFKEASEAVDASSRVTHGAGGAAHLHGAAEPSEGRGRISGVVAALVHTVGYLFVTGLLAVVVYYWAGLRLLRAAWINLDVIWAGALVVTALLTPFL